MTATNPLASTASATAAAMLQPPETRTPAGSVSSNGSSSNNSSSNPTPSHSPSTSVSEQASSVAEVANSIVGQLRVREINIEEYAGYYLASINQDQTTLIAMQAADHTITYQNRRKLMEIKEWVADNAQNFINRYKQILTNRNEQPGANLSACIEKMPQLAALISTLTAYQLPPAPQIANELTGPSNREVMETLLPKGDAIKHKSFSLPKANPASSNTAAAQPSTTALSVSTATSLPNNTPVNPTVNPTPAANPTTAAAAQLPAPQPQRNTGHVQVTPQPRSALQPVPQQPSNPTAPPQRINQHVAVTPQPSTGLQPTPQPTAAVQQPTPQAPPQRNNQHVTVTPQPSTGLQPTPQPSNGSVNNARARFASIAASQPTPQPAPQPRRQSRWTVDTTPVTAAPQTATEQTEEQKEAIRLRMARLSGNSHHV